MDTEKYIRVNTDNTFDKIEVDPNNLLDGFYDAISCDCIETVELGKIAGVEILGILDESGRLKDKPSNLLASVFYPYETLVGDMLLSTTGYRDGEPDIIGLTDDQISRVSEVLQNLQKVLPKSMKVQMADAKAAAEQRNAPSESQPNRSTLEK